MTTNDEGKFVSAEDLTACILERKKIRAALVIEQQQFKEARDAWGRYKDHKDVMGAGKEKLRKLDAKIDQLAAQMGQGILPGCQP